MLETEGRRVEFQSPGDDHLGREVAPDVRRHALLFFKEVITNVARHANATAVRVEVATAGGSFRISIRDNGRGFDPLHARPGQGLKSLRYRAQELRATCHVESAPERGTEIVLSVPL
jgi:signal transduction histidine kinase